MSGDGDAERRARLIARIESRNAIRAAEAPEPQADPHALAWGRIAHALKAGRNPSIDDLLGAIAADPTIPEAVQIYAQRLRSREVKPTGGPRPRWGLNHDAWQSTRDIILIETFETLRRDLERRGAEASDAAVFAEFKRRRWGSAEAWGAMAAESDDRKRWGTETARSRYFEAKGRFLDALRPTGAEDL